MLDLGLCNYYGEVCLEEINGKWYLSLDDWSDKRYVEISEKLAKAIKEEFANEKVAITEGVLFSEED